MNTLVDKAAGFFIFIALVVALAGCPPPHSLAITVSGEGTVTTNPMGTPDFVPNSMVVVTAAPSVGWRFDHWEGDLTGNASPASITMDTDKSVKAVFGVAYALAINLNGTGSVALASPGGVYAPGTTVTLTPTAPANWQFDHWEGDLTGNANPASITMDANKTVTAVFLPLYALAINTMGDGSVQLIPPGGIYLAGTSVTMAARPGVTSQLDHWEGDYNNIGYAPTIVMDSNKTVTAVFTPLYTLTINMVGQGFAFAVPHHTYYQRFDSVLLNATPIAGWHFQHWEGDIDGAFLPYTLEMDASKVITAVFTGPANILLPGDITLSMVWCPAAHFEMGRYLNEGDSNADEDPQHLAFFSEGFWISKYPVTQAQWENVMSANPSQFQDIPMRPVEQVSWNDICAQGGFLDRLGQATNMTFTLPTEAQWEYACRAGTNTRFYWGDDFNNSDIANYTWYSENSDMVTHGVGQKLGNAWDIFDMGGNVWEWCQDWYGPYPANAVIDSKGPDTGTNRVTRGGAWDSTPDDCRSARRNSQTPDYAAPNLGFRLVRTR